MLNLNQQIASISTHKIFTMFSVQKEVMYAEQCQGHLYYLDHCNFPADTCFICNNCHWLFIIQAKQPHIQKKISLVLKSYNNQATLQWTKMAYNPKIVYCFLFSIHFPQTLQWQKMEYYFAKVHYWISPWQINSNLFQ